MRVLLLRRGLPLVALLLAVLVHTAPGAILACPAGVPERAVALAAVVEPVSGHDICPGRVPEPFADSGRAQSSESPTLPIGSDPCSSDRPCQHAPSGDDGPGDTALPRRDEPRDLSPVALALRLSPDLLQRQATYGAGPLSVRHAPVAVLCVDRS